MINNDITVGGGILKTLTESLYDNPIVVFREYVQNSVDSIKRIRTETNCEILKSEIWRENDNLFFLDNGEGISEDSFKSKMKDLGNSDKHKDSQIGYKGIGRLSGLPYCDKLVFVNIISYKGKEFQICVLDGAKYKNIMTRIETSPLSYAQVMDKIISFENGLPPEAEAMFNKTGVMFEKQDTGLMVMLINCSSVLRGVLDNNNLEDELSWLLPVEFKSAIYECNQKEAFIELETPIEQGSTKVIPAEKFNISYNGEMIKRPIESDNLRAVTCLRDFKYGIGLYTFNQTKLDVDRKNPFSGIKIYLDNVLLCDESDLIPTLSRFNVINSNSVNEMIVTAKGIGALIYITEKALISANARRNFIEVSDDYSFDFLKIIACFLEQVYTARYSMSKFQSALKKNVDDTGKTNELREKATFALTELARQDCPVIPELTDYCNFDDLLPVDKKAAIQKKISKYMTNKIKEYINQTTDLDFKDAEENFLAWLGIRD